MKTYEYSWPMILGPNSFDGNQVIHPEFITETLPNNYIKYEFYNPRRDKPPIPTKNGWINLFKNESIITKNFPMNNSPQFTIQFEVFPLENNSSFNMEIIEVGANHYQSYGYLFKLTFRATFGKYWTGMRIPWQVKYGVKLEPFKWNRVLINI